MFMREAIHTHSCKSSWWNLVATVTSRLQTPLSSEGKIHHMKNNTLCLQLDAVASWHTTNTAPITVLAVFSALLWLIQKHLV